MRRRVRQKKARENEWKEGEMQEDGSPQRDMRREDQAVGGSTAFAADSGWRAAVRRDVLEAGPKASKRLL